MRSEQIRRTIRAASRAAFGWTSSILIVVGLTASAASADAIFVANSGGFGPGNPGTIGKYNVDGSTVNAALVTGLAAPFGLAAGDGNLYVSNNDAATVGKYTEAGATVSASLIAIGGPTAINLSGASLFVEGTFDAAVKQYSSANGSLLNGAVVAGPNGIRQMAISGATLYTADNATGTVGKYTTSGTVINASLITGLAGLTGIAVSADGASLFVTSQNTDVISQYTSTGTLVNASLISGLSAPQNLAVVGSTLYVVNFGNGSVGKYTTGGATINASLISGLNGPLSIAVVPEPASLATAGAAATLLVARRRR